ncbi:MAG: hypothetical protein ACE5HV_03660 [Acidobacteriota bacterium]
MRLLRILPVTLLLIVVAIPASPLPAREGKAGALDSAWCGTHRWGFEVSLARHLDQLRRLERQGIRRRGVAAGIGPRVSQAGDIAVIEDDGTLVSAENPFDLAGEAVQFSRRRNGVRAQNSSATVSGSLGKKLALGDDDSVWIDFPNRFSFKFFGQKYSGVFINSDGNLTFGEADFEPLPRSLARFLNGPPRIAPLFADLNPAAATDDGGIYLKATRTRVRITWSEVPEFGSSNANTFQITLLRNGRITFAYGDLAAEEGVVGVAPGGGGALLLLDYTADLATGPEERAIAEGFSTREQVDDLAVASVFFDRFVDDYDHLIVWLDFPAFLGGAFAFEVNVKNDVRGIGLPVFDHSPFFGSQGRLESHVQMGALSRYPEDPDETFLSTNSTMDILGQETGHRWLAYVRFRDANGKMSTDLLGRGLTHWNFNHDTDASDMEGNDIRDNGDSTFTTVEATSRYSRLDRYMMGLIRPNAVADFFYAQDSPILVDGGPQVGVTFPGARVDVRVEDVIAAEGMRQPTSKEAPKSFRMAFILVGRRGEPPSQASIDQVDRYRRRWAGYFRAATGNKGSAKTRLLLK